MDQTNERQYIHDRMDRIEKKVDTAVEGISELKVLIIPKVNEIQEMKERINIQNEELTFQKEKIQHLESKLKIQSDKNDTQQQMVDKMEKLYYRILYGGGGVMLVLTILMNFNKIIDLLNALGS